MRGKKKNAPHFTTKPVIITILFSEAQISRGLMSNSTFLFDFNPKPVVTLAMQCSDAIAKTYQAPFGTCLLFWHGFSRKTNDKHIFPPPIKSTVCSGRHPLTLYMIISLEISLELCCIAKQQTWKDEALLPLSNACWTEKRKINRFSDL